MVEYKGVCLLCELPDMHGMAGYRLDQNANMYPKQSKFFVCWIYAERCLCSSISTDDKTLLRFTFRDRKLKCAIGFTKQGNKVMISGSEKWQSPLYWHQQDISVSPLMSWLPFYLLNRIYFVVLLRTFERSCFLLPFWVCWNCTVQNLQFLHLLELHSSISLMLVL